MRFLFASCCLALFLSTLLAEEPKKSSDSAWQKHFRTQAGEYRFEFANEKDPQTKLLEAPVMYWSQPVRGGDEGAVFLWERRGQPVAIGTLFIWPLREGGQGVTHELHSLSSEPFTATWNRRIWAAPEDAVEYHELATEESPGDSAARRLSQMKKLARELEAANQREDSWTPLRLLARELYRYTPDAKESKVIDGAVFGFVHGTDLEVVLLMEARRGAAKPSWHCAFARMSDLPLRVKRGDKQIWSVDRGNFERSKEAWYCGTVETRNGAPE